MSGMRLRFLFVACISISSLVRAEDKDTARCLGGACRTTLPSSSGCGKSAMTQFSPPVDGIRLHPIRRLSLTSSGKSTLECAEACVSRGEACKSFQIRSLGQLCELMSVSPLSGSMTSDGWTVYDRSAPCNPLTELHETTKAKAMTRLPVTTRDYSDVSSMCVNGMWYQVGCTVAVSWLGAKLQVEDPVAACAMRAINGKQRKFTLTADRLGCKVGSPTAVVLSNKSPCPSPYHTVYAVCDMLVEPGLWPEETQELAETREIQQRPSPDAREASVSSSSSTSSSSPESTCFGQDPTFCGKYAKCNENGECGCILPGAAVDGGCRAIPLPPCSLGGPNCGDHGTCSVTSRDSRYRQCLCHVGYAVDSLTGTCIASNGGTVINAEVDQLENSKVDPALVAAFGILGVVIVIGGAVLWKSRSEARRRTEQGDFDHFDMLSDTSSCHELSPRARTNRLTALVRDIRLQNQAPDLPITLLSTNGPGYASYTIPSHDTELEEHSSEIIRHLDLNTNAHDKFDSVKRIDDRAATASLL